MTEKRTDLALEVRESFPKNQVEVKGVILEKENFLEGKVRVTKVQIKDDDGSRAMGKPKGTYITIESRELLEEGENREQLLLCVCEQLEQMVPSLKEKAVLVVGLGNREVTADALGPGVVDNLFITRHIVREYGKAAYNKERMNVVSSIVPGVMAATGMETAEIVRGVISQTEPDLVIVVDALAARSTKRLNRTIQITDTGIHPGSGVGNHRNGLTEESLGVPVIAIGVPTVVDAGTIVSDALEKLVQESGEGVENLKTDCLHTMTELNNMYVTGKDIDEVIKRLSFTISEALNIALEL